MKTTEDDAVFFFGPLGSCLRAVLARCFDETWAESLVMRVVMIL